MSVKEFAAHFKKTLEEIKAQGTAAIYCDDLIEYMNKVIDAPEPEPTPIGIERFKADLQGRIETQRAHNESQLELFRSVITAGQSALKSAFLLNGGAAVALLAFIGHLAQFKPAAVPVFASSLIPFTVGVLAVSLTTGFTYLSQWLYASPNAAPQKVGFGLNLLCIGLGLSSYGFFVWGLLEARAAFLCFA